MHHFNLEKIGLNRNEAKVYLALVRRGSATAGVLIKDTAFHRNIVYDNLEKLIDRGLATYIISDGKKLFQARPPSYIMDNIDREEKEIKERRKIADEIVSQLDRIYGSENEETKSTIFRGVAGIRHVFSDILDTRKDYSAIGVSKESEDIMGDVFWRNFHAKRRTLKVNATIILNHDYKEYSGNFLNDKTIKFRILPRRFKVLSETLIYGTKVAIIVFGTKPVATLIEDKAVADSYRKHFELLSQTSQELISR
ncbi:MAG: helix-turn-helix domain-containing protein [archaeon]